jgi:hypothetical protein
MVWSLYLRKCAKPCTPPSAASPGAACSATYLCLTEFDPGEPIVFHDRFPTPDGRVKLVPVDIIPANERPDTDYPFVQRTHECVPARSVWRRGDG